MAAFREDAAWAWRGYLGLSNRKQEPWDEVVFRGLEAERVDLENEEDDEEWRPGASDGEELTSDEETDSGCENASGTLDEDFTVQLDDKSEMDDRSEYLTWLEQMAAKTEYDDDSPAYPSDSSDVDKITKFRKMRQLAEEFRVKVPTEIRAPWRVPVEAIEEPLRSEIKEGKHKQRCVHGFDPVPLYLLHPINVLAQPTGDHWEHLAGPDCRAKEGYLGTRISADEMFNCNVAQAIVTKDASTDWETESTDEDWEKAASASWHLTGLVDTLSEREFGTTTPYPKRHANWTRFHHMDCINFETRKTAMTFHPPCLEVFKRASLKRHGYFDINALGDAWIKAANDFDRLPRAKPVEASSEQWWIHHVRSEYLAANPCFVPSLKKLLESSRVSHIVVPRSVTAHGLLALPTEIQHSIMLHLDISDITSTGLSSQILRKAAQNVLKSRLPHDMPHLWELWCDMPYSRWTGTSAAAVEAAQTASNEQEEEIARALQILKEEGYHEAHADYKQYWDDSRAERKRKALGPLQEKATDFVNIEEIDLVEFVCRLEKAQRDDQVKGLRNRERIWVDCNKILDLIEGLQEEGRISPSSG